VEPGLASEHLIREGRETDVGDLLRLIRQLAEYEREPAAVKATDQVLARSLFGTDPLARVFVAEKDGSVVGMALWFLTYSTWTGKPGLYLEDLIVEAGHRGEGIGQALMAALRERAVELGCARMEWSVLDWNEPAIHFYRSLGARPMDEWTTWRIELPEA
jgi:GNAT superfamily N-acetyltransferase